MAVSRGVRFAWIVGGSLFTAVTIGFGTAQAVAGLAHEERDVHTVVDEPIRAVDVSASGSVTVLGSRRSTVSIDERVSDGLQKPDRSIRVAGERLVVRGTCGEFLATFCSDDIVLRVPRSVRVLVRAEGITVAGVSGGADLDADGGGITVRSVSGAMRLRSHGGGITARRIDANVVEAGSDGGNVTLELVSPPRLIDASSRGGSISVVLPDRRVAYVVEASADGGSIDTSIRTDPTSPNMIRAESDGGGISIRYTSG